MYDNWMNCGTNDSTFIEMQNKIKYLLKYLLLNLKIGNGLFQMCKKHPEIKLKSTPYMLDENGLTLYNQESETLELSTMLITCINNYSKVFTEDDFETLGGPLHYVLENRDILEDLQKEIFEYQDVYYIYDDEEREEREEREEENSVRFVEVNSE